MSQGYFRLCCCIKPKYHSDATISNRYSSCYEASYKNYILTPDTDGLRDATVAWLDYFDCTDKHDSIRRRRQKGTCSWISVDKTYVRWRDSNKAGELLWLTGIRMCIYTIICTILYLRFHSWHREDIHCMSGVIPIHHTD